MITTCTVCQARYQLEDDKIPRRVVRVRCPACSGVFSLDGTRLADKPAWASANPEPVHAPAPVAPAAPAAKAAPAPDAPFVEHGFGPMTPAPTPAPAPVAAAPRPAPAARPAASVAAVAEAEPEPSAAAPRRRRSKEEMLARALVSDILVYNRDQRDAALRNGTLVEALGAEIKKSWELYKEKVGPEVANSTNHFRDALNEILADGQKMF
ncbi:MAG TPA: zinc-ribbon domain-containing protein [Candidatus Krumholzibacteria bacterium]|nr:zinc-ribbon domain-containing protein [Candidatus Krumholzibacteria bacterium]